MTPPRNAAIDFDGTLNNWKASPKHNGWGPPMQGAQNGMIHLRGMGLRLVVFTVKAHTPAGIRAVEDWLQQYKIPYDEVTALKPPAVVYLDDRAVRFTDWTTAVPDIKAFLRGTQ